RSHPAPDVADAGRLHLDHVGALVREDADRPRPGERDREVDDADPSERSGPMAFARPPHGLRSPATRCAKLALAAETCLAKPFPPHIHVGAPFYSGREVDPCATGSPISSPGARPGSTR